MAELKRVTQQMVADRAGVARSTAALILSNHVSAARFDEDTRRRVTTAAQSLQYRPSEVARQLRGEKSSIIGVLIGATDAQVNYRCLSAIEHLVSRRGCRLLIGQLHTDSCLVRDYVHDFLSRGVNSVICLQHESPLTDSECVPKTLQAIEHVVYLDQPVGVKNVCYIQQDFSAGIRMAVEHVAERGAKRIAAIFETTAANCNRRRYEGYCQALKNAGLALDPALVSIAETELPRIPDPALVHEWVDRLVVRQKADTLIANNDLWAVEILYAVLDRGYSVPRDVRIVGYDNIDVSQACRPQLTTVDSRSVNVASLLVEALFAQGDAKAGVSGGEKIVEPKLVVRQST